MKFAANHCFMTFRTTGLIFDIIDRFKRIMERTNLCICCCTRSPEAVLYLYVFLEALGVQEVQEGLVVQVHLLHLCTKQSTMSQARMKPAEN